ncbi:MAG TPA: MFS transporter [Acetobacteraceae bacterium]|nr:MFS transporter [Acetobacteraceae bacterium]
MPRLLARMMPLFAATFIDLFSFGLMYPVIVALFQQPAVRAIYGDGSSSFTFSLALALFPLGMFFGASLLGDISDAFGRRRTLLICMAGLAASYALMLLGVVTLHLGWLLAGRLLSGLMAGTGPIAQAAMIEADAADGRGGALAKIVLVNCLALVSGPAVGGLLMHFGFAAPLVFTIGLCAMAFVWLAAARIETGEAHGRLRIGPHRAFEVFVHAWRHPVIRGLACAFFLFQFGFAIWYVYVMVRMARVYGLPPTTLGLFSAVIGAGFVFGSTLGYRWLVRAAGSDAVAVAIAIVGCGALIALSALPLGGGLQWPLAFAIAVANVPVFVGILALISAAAASGEQGWAMGIGGAMTALSFMLSGLLAPVLTVVPLPLLIVAGGVVVIAGALPLRSALRVPPVPAVAV